MRWLLAIQRNVFDVPCNYKKYFIVKILAIRNMFFWHVIHVLKNVFPNYSLI